MYFFLRILRKLRLLKYFKGRFELSLENKNFEIPVLNGIGMDHFPASEPWMSECIKRLLPMKVGNFVDVGVNIGQTLLKLRSLSDCEYVGFEPNQNCIEYVHALIQSNHLNHLTIVPYGISDRDEEGLLHAYFDQSTDSSASLIATFRPESKVMHTTQVSLIGPQTLLGYLQKPVAIIKIDVEGFEWFVIKGLEQIIARDRPFLLVEILPVYDASGTDRLERQQQIERLLMQNKYVIFRILKNADDSFHQFERIEKIGIHSDLKFCEYLIAPAESEIHIVHSATAIDDLIFKSQ